MKNTLHHLSTGFTFLALLAASACQTQANEASGESSADSSGEGSTQDDASTQIENGQKMTLMVELEGGDQLNFLTTAGSVVQRPKSDIAGKPVYIAVFPGGFAQGVDHPLFEFWDSMPDDMKLEVVTPAQFADGPYDVAVIVYTSTKIGSEEMDAEFPPLPVAGELASFTLDQSEVKDGDPGFSNGVIRVNIEGDDESMHLLNHADPNDVAKSFNNTILVVP